jgi:hypothetical protein
VLQELKDLLGQQEQQVFPDHLEDLLAQLVYKDLLAQLVYKDLRDRQVDQ